MMEPILHKSTKEFVVNETSTNKFLLVIEHSNKTRILEVYNLPECYHKSSNEDIKKYFTNMITMKKTKCKLIKISRLHQIEKAIKI